MLKNSNSVYKRIHWEKVLQVAIPVVLVVLSALVFVIRYLPAFQIPNFYAEDGEVYANAVLTTNPLSAMFTWFNGYLIVGQYILIEIAIFLYQISGESFSKLPLFIAIVSCLFLGLTVSLPYILFKDKLGKMVALLAVFFGAFVALPSFDYAIIGTIGNLKFLFLYWAFLFALYRNFNADNTKKVIFIDLILLICVLTYLPSVALLPFLLWPYRLQLLRALKARSLKSFQSPAIISLLILCFVSIAYIIIVYARGIPAIPGYLDTPYNLKATPKLAFRVTWYQWLVNIAPTMRDSVTVGLLFFTGIFASRNPKNRFILLFGTWSIFIATASFVINRPGISTYFLNYGSSPDQFFYAQTLVFMFLCLWFTKDWINGLNKMGAISLLIGIGIFMWWSVNSLGSFGKHRVVYERLGTSEANVQRACESNNDIVNLQLYPTEEWNWAVKRAIACK